MRRLAGQAALALGQQLHRLLTVLLAIAMLSTAGVGLLAWRLAQRPLDITWIVRRIEAAASPGGDAARVSVASAALAWEGWRLGLDHPLDIRLTGITAARPGRPAIATIPAAELSLSFAALLRGRLVPRAIGIDGARLRVLRDTSGTGSLDLGAPAGDLPAENPSNPFNALLTQFGEPAANDHTRDEPGGLWSQLVRVRISDAQVVVIDRQLGAIWRAPHADIDLHRRALGGIDATADITLALGDHITRITATASVPVGGGGAVVHAGFTALAPASLVLAAPSLAPLKAVDAPVEGSADLTLGPAFSLRGASLHATMGPGTVLVAQGAVAVAGADLSLATDMQSLTMTHLRIALVGPDGGQGPMITASGAAHRAGQGYGGSLALDVDQVAFADLSRYWPPGAARDARTWVTANLTAGTARAAHVDLGLAVSATQELTLTSATGQMTGDDVSIWWLRPVPPIEHAQATLTVVSPDELAIAAVSGRQSGGQLLLHNTSLRITGLAASHQVGAIDTTIAGPVADALSLLHQPRLHLLSRHPIALTDPAGQVTTRLTLTVPLEDRVTIDQIPIHAQGQLSALHLGHVAAGRDLDQGMLDLDVTNDGLRLGGPAVLAGIPATIGVKMDFAAGPSSQVVQTLSVSGAVTAPQIAALGLDTGGVLGGAASLQASLVERRDGGGVGIVHVDLRDASLAVAKLGWQKPIGAAASGDVRVALDHDRPVAVERLALDGDGVSVAGHAEFAGGALATLHLDRVVLGATRVAGQIRFPANGRDPIRATVTGSALDLSGLFARRAEKSARDEAPGRPWAVTLQLGQVILGRGRALSAVSGQADDDGTVLRHAMVEGHAASADHFQIVIAPRGPGAADGRQLSAHASDAGALLRAFDLVDSLQGGVLSINGRYDDTAADHPLTGTAELTEFRLRDAPVAARVLKAMTLYGMADVLSGPGLGFARMMVPFRLTSGALDLMDARAFSAALGFTAKGHVDLDQRVVDVQGTVVPAYFFNTLLGRVPLMGRLFSPEPGGGVFAVTYGVKGAIDDPAVSVNPLAALTPGFLRGLFGIF